MARHRKFTASIGGKQQGIWGYVKIRHIKNEKKMIFMRAHQKNKKIKKSEKFLKIHKIKNSLFSRQGSKHKNIF
jgi:hypothetical protein